MANCTSCGNWIPEEQDAHKEEDNREYERMIEQQIDQEE
jgi:hypothetical protein